VPLNSNLPTPPKSLAADGRKLWASIVEAFDLDPAALSILEAACLSQDRETAAMKAIKAEGMTTTDRYGRCKAHPAVLIERDSRAAKLKALKQLGLDLEPVNPIGRPAKGSPRTLLTKGAKPDAD
jgi:P27 family predicted phage terminase small subunit